MGCCLGVLGVMFPRLALVAMWLTGYGGRAFETMLWPILGFVTLPYTTCGYAIAMNQFGEVRGWGLACVIFGAFLDITSHGGAASRGNRYRRQRLSVD